MSPPARRPPNQGRLLLVMAGIGIAGALLVVGLRAPARAPVPASAAAPAPVPAPPPVGTGPPAAGNDDVHRPAAPAPDNPLLDGQPRGQDRERDAMDQIRALLRADPERALALIDAADRAHAAGRFAEERAATRVDALVFARRIGPARDAAEEFLTRYPQSPRAQHIQVLTGVHPHPAEPQD